MQGPSWVERMLNTRCELGGMDAQCKVRVGWNGCEFGGMDAQCTVKPLYKDPHISDNMLENRYMAVFTEQRVTSPGIRSCTGRQDVLPFERKHLRGALKE